MLAGLLFFCRGVFLGLHKSSARQGHDTRLLVPHLLNISSARFLGQTRVTFSARVKPPREKDPRCQYPTSDPLLGSCVGHRRAAAVSRFTQAKASVRLRKYLSPGSGRDASCNLFAGLYFGFIYICSCQSLMCGPKPYLPCEAAVASSSLSTNL